MTSGRGQRFVVRVGVRLRLRVRLRASPDLTLT